MSKSFDIPLIFITWMDFLLPVLQEEKDFVWIACFLRKMKEFCEKYYLSSIFQVCIYLK